MLRASVFRAQAYAKAERMLGRNRRLLADLKRKWRKHVLGVEGSGQQAAQVRAEDIVHLYDASMQVLCLLHPRPPRLSKILSTLATERGPTI